MVGIIDGDTLDTSKGRVRLFGVDTPERSQRCATEATERLRELTGDVVSRSENWPRLRDTYGRVLASTAWTALIRRRIIPRLLAAGLGPLQLNFCHGFLSACLVVAHCPQKPMTASLSEGLPDLL